MIDHDAVFKQVLREFFVEFLDLFCPAALSVVDTTRINFLDKELFADLVDPNRREADLIAQVGVQGQAAFFVIHLEHQAQEDKALDRRMFRYFSRLYERYDAPIYPIALCSYASPRTPVADRHVVMIAELPVLTFQYRTVQLNQLDWRAYLRNANPLAAALMARMQIAARDHVQVKAACLSRLLGMALSPRRQRILASFVGIYLPLTPSENDQVIATVQAQYGANQEVAMVDIMEIAQQAAREAAVGEEMRLLVQMLLEKRIGVLEPSIRAQVDRLPMDSIKALAVDLLDFTSRADLDPWLAQHGVPPEDIEDAEDGEGAEDAALGL